MHELNKKQLILLTLLITFVVSIATGIITVSIMQQMPKTVPQTINNVIQRTIERVTTVPAETPVVTEKNVNQEKTVMFGDGDALVSIYAKDTIQVVQGPGQTVTTNEAPKALGEGIIISDIGLVMVDSSILTDKNVYKVTLNKMDFDATVIKKFTNGFTILKISQKKASTEDTKDTEKTPAVDSTQ